MKNFFKNILQYFSPELIKSIQRILKFLLVYTIIFIIIAAGFKYAIPFVIAFIIAILLKPIKNRILSLNKKFESLGCANGIVSFLLTLLIVSGIAWLVFIIGVNLVQQLKSLYVYITNKDTLDMFIVYSKEKVNLILNALGKNLTPDIMTEINDGLASIIESISSIISLFLKNLLNIVVSIPTAFLMILITIIATFFFTKDIDKIQVKIKGIFSEKGLRLLDKLNKKKNEILGGYVKAYTLIMIALFIYCIIAFKIAGIKYAVVIALLTAIIDALPLFGAGLVYGFLVIASFIEGDYKKAIILIIGYIGIVAVRQFLEQQLVSSFLGLNPLIVIIGLFIALTPLGFKGMFYFIGAFLVYEALYSTPKKKNKKDKYNYNKKWSCCIIKYSHNI